MRAGRSGSTRSLPGTRACVRETVISPASTAPPVFKAIWRAPRRREAAPHRRSLGIIRELSVLPKSLDHLVRQGEQQRGDIDADRLGGVQIDDRAELRRLFDRKIAGVGALEYPVHEEGGAAIHWGKVDAIASEATVLGQFKGAECGKAARCGQSGDRG